jgi:hypothetical protein
MLIMQNLTFCSQMWYAVSFTTKANVSQVMNDLRDIFNCKHRFVANMQGEYLKTYIALKQRTSSPNKFWKLITFITTFYQFTKRKKLQHIITTRRAYVLENLHEQ